MRNISEAGLAKLAEQYGNEPITIVEVDWMDEAAPRFYADRDVEGIPGRIITVGDMDNVINVSSNSNSQSLEVTLDDTDGTIKAIFDAHDIHKRGVRVWQYFEGLDLSDKFLLFAGKISTPVLWSERDRTVRFTIISQLEDKEVGFSAEEGQFPYLPADMVGKAWPMIFGKVLDCPALQVNEAVQGTTLTPVGALAGLSLHSSTPIYSSGSDVDQGLGMTLAHISMQLSALWCGHYCWDGVNDARADDLLDQINTLERQRSEAISQAAQQKACIEQQRAEQLNKANTGLGINPLKVLGGEDFPQNQTLTIDINGCWFTGYFQGQEFYIQSRYWVEGEVQAAKEAEDRDDSCPSQDDGGAAKFDYRVDVPCGCGGMYNTCECRNHGFIVSTGTKRGTEMSDDSIIQHFWADAGSTVRIYSAEPITYIVSITPGTVLAVKAYKQFTGERRLIAVPSDLYRVETKVYGTVTAVQLVFNRPLSSIADQGWSDDVYVTFESTIGPNTVDILKYLIDNYTDLAYDATTFNYVHDKLIPFPANFPILERKNTLQVLQEIAYQARCALWISNGVFYLKYLPEEPAANGTITVSDIDAENSIEVELTPTEDLVTKMKVKWRMSWAPGATDRPKDKSEKWMILRHNISRYGTHEEEYDWYIYNQPDTILKCATFWLIRKSHSWKRIRFQTFLHKLNLETLDCVNLDFAGGYVANAAVKALVERADYNSADNLMNFECLVPVRAGTMEKFQFFWPSAIAVEEMWPPQEDIDTSDAGGGGIGMGATGQLPIGYTDGIESGGTVFVGGPNVVFRSQSDWGDRHPTDVGFTPQTVINPAVYGELQASSKPHLDLRLKLLRSSKPIQLQDLKGGISIDLARTIIVDSRGDPKNVAHLTSIFYGINENGQLMVKDGALVADDERPQGAEFDFEYDTEQEVFGAGTAFLRD